MSKECLILKEFVRLAGDEKARIVVMTTATDSPREAAIEYTAIFERLGVKHIEAIDVAQRGDAMKPESVEAVKKRRAYFFTGGSKPFSTRRILSSKLAFRVDARTRF